jgi:hypothetical protein
VANHTKGGHPGGSVIGFKEMMGMKMKKARGSKKANIVEEIAPEEVESVTQTTDDIDTNGSVTANSEASGK